MSKNIPLGTNTGAFSPSWNLDDSKNLWIAALTGAGKTTFLFNLYQNTRALFPDAIIIHMTEHVDNEIAKFADVTVIDFKSTFRWLLDYSGQVFIGIDDMGHVDSNFYFKLRKHNKANVHFIIATHPNDTFGPPGQALEPLLQTRLFLLGRDADVPVGFFHGEINDQIERFNKRGVQLKWYKEGIISYDYGATAEVIQLNV